MMKKLKSVGVTIALFCLLLAGCRHMAQSEPEAGTGDSSAKAVAAPSVDAKAMNDAKERLARVTALVKLGKLAEADEELKPLAGGEMLADEVKNLQDEIKIRRVEEDKIMSPELSRKIAIQQADNRLNLPETYGQTVIITRENQPLEIPPGPMEQLVNRKVTMQLTDAKFNDIIMVLSKFDGLNIVADKTLSENPGTLTLQVKDVPLKEILGYIARNMGVAFYVSENIIWVTRGETSENGMPEMETRIYKLRRGFIPSLGGGGEGDSGGDDELDKVLEMFLAKSPEGAIYKIFKNRNLLVVKNTRDNLRLIEQMIRDFDKEPLQVLIESRYVTISQKKLQELGVNITRLDKKTGGQGYGDNDLTQILNNLKPQTETKFVTNPLTLLQEPITTIIPLDPAVQSFWQNQLALAATRQTPKTSAASSIFPFNNTTGGTLAFTSVLGNGNYEILLKAIAETDKSATVAAPRVTVMNNQTAEIFQGETLRYFEEYDLSTATNTNGVSTSTPVPTGAPIELQLGKTLQVKVNVGNDAKRVVLNIKTEITNFEGYDEFANAKLPKTSDNRVTTTVTVDSGETVVLGGMITNVKQDTVQKIPLLGDIPLLGILFRHTTNNYEPSHLLIFITATIVGPSGEFLDYREK